MAQRPNLNVPSEVLNRLSRDPAAGAIEGAGQTLASLPELYRQYKLRQMQLAQQEQEMLLKKQQLGQGDRKLDIEESKLGLERVENVQKFGTGGPTRVAQLPGALPTPQESQALAASGQTLDLSTPLSEEQQLQSLGTEGFGEVSKGRARDAAATKVSQQTRSAKALDEPLPRQISDAVWKSAGLDPKTNKDLPVLTDRQRRALLQVLTVNQAMLGKVMNLSKTITGKIDPKKLDDVLSVVGEMGFSQVGNPFQEETKDLFDLSADDIKE